MVRVSLVGNGRGLQDMFDMKCIGKIYERLQDEESKMIYINRLNYTLTQDYGFIENIVDLTIRSQPLWKQFCRMLIENHRGQGMVIFGSGVWGNILYRESREFVSWKYVIDSNPRNKRTGPLPVVAFGDFVRRYAGETIVISSYKNCREMKEQLLRNGIPKKNIIDAGNVIYELTEKRIYFDLQELLPRKDQEIFVDAGGFDGMTTKQFLSWCGGNGYSYCFEPDEQNMAKAERNLNDSGLYEIVPRALWSETTELEMNAKGNFATSVGVAGSGGEMVKAVALDDFLADREITFLKMDIEGAEEEALRGAKRVISEQKPRLAISIYHKREDIWTLPGLIMKICPDYNFYLRHYSFYGYDTVLYGIPSWGIICTGED